MLIVFFLIFLNIVARILEEGQKIMGIFSKIFWFQEELR